MADHGLLDGGTDSNLVYHSNWLHRHINGRYVRRFLTCLIFSRMYLILLPFFLCCVFLRCVFLRCVFLALRWQNRFMLGAKPDN